MLEFLKPISGNHSIGVVSAVLIVQQNFLRIEKLFDQINGVDGIHFKYPRRNLTYIQPININADFGTLSKKSKEIDGFLLESFDEKGRLNNILKLKNNTEKQTSIIFETRNYKSWIQFLDDLLDSISIISNIYSFYINAISLNYIDDFTWVSKDQIPVREIFRTNSQFINEKFLESDTAAITFHSQKELEDGKSNEEDKIELSFSNRVKKIIINHQVAKSFSNLEFSQDMLSSNVLKSNFELAHQLNKGVLKDILSDKVLSHINLK